MGGFIPRTDFSQLLHLADLTEHYALHMQEAEALGQTTHCPANCAGELQFA